MIAFYLPRPDGSFTSTSATTSPWDPSLQHGGPPTALLARAIEAHEPRPDMAIGRISVDFLGPIPQGVMEVDVEILRPGKRIELLEARLRVEGRVTVVARAWRSQVVAGSAPNVAAPMVHDLPGPQEQSFFPGVPADWGYGRAIEWRFLKGAFDELGPSLVWARPLLPLVAGEAPTGLQRALIVADSTNGLSGELDLTQWVFVPPTLTVTTFREPEGEWILLDARTSIASRGTGLAHATLYDRTGEFGVASQPLLVQPRG